MTVISFQGFLPFKIIHIARYFLQDFNLNNGLYTSVPHHMPLLSNGMHSSRFSERRRYCIYNLLPARQLKNDPNLIFRLSHIATREFPQCEPDGNLFVNNIALTSNFIVFHAFVFTIMFLIKLFKCFRQFLVQILWFIHILFLSSQLWFKALKTMGWHHLLLLHGSHFFLFFFDKKN